MPEGFDEYFAGGICGYNYHGGIIDSCTNVGRIVSYGTNTGGICGRNVRNSTIKNCANMGDVVASGECAGGVCGANDGSVIAYCSNSGAVSFTGENANCYGGICGSCTTNSSGDGQISYCYNTGAVSGAGRVGGICGNFRNGPIVTYCYNIGTVTATTARRENIGDIYGYAANLDDGGQGYREVSNCYYLNTSSLAQKEKTTPLSAGEMKSPRFLFSLSLESKVNADDRLFIPSNISGFDYPVLGSVAELDANEKYNFLSSGSGTSVDPYNITEMEELYYLSYLVNSRRMNFEGKVIVLGNDIVFGNDDAWVPVGTENEPFMGTFDGKGTLCEIIGLKIHEAEGKYKGLFGNNAGTITGVSVVNCDIYALNNVGGICAYNTGRIEGCSCTGDIVMNTSTIGENIGGICGTNAGTVSYCSADVDIIGSNKVGGICGNNSGSIRFCFAKGTLGKGSAGYYENFGGIVGYNTATLGNCYGTVSCDGKESDENNKVAGVCNGGVFTNCYYDREVWKIVGDDSSSALTTGQMKSLGFLLLLNHGNTDPQGFVLDDGTVDGYPAFGSALDYASNSDYNFTLSAAQGTQADPYVITTANQLYYLTYLVYSGANSFQDKTITLGNDIDLANTADCSWIPIGSRDEAFKGTFDGDGYSVSRVYIGGNNSIQGFLGRNTGTITNLNIRNSTINGYSFVGGLCAVNAGIISNCSNAATVNGNCYIGGVCGDNYGEVSSCYNIGTVTAEHDSGAICGGGASSSSVTNCCYLDSCCAYAVADAGHADVTSLTQTQFEDGAAAWCLNGNGTANPAWYQTIGTNAYPVQNKTAGVVYQNGEDDFSNYFFENINIELGSDIAMNYYLASSFALGGKKMRFTMNELSTVADVIETVDDSGDTIYKVVYSDIAPQCIGDEVTAELLDTDGITALATKKYSVLTYLNKLKSMTYEQLSMAQDAKTKMDTLIDNLLFYGAAAQTYVGHKTESLIADISGMVFTELTDTASIKEVSNGEGVEFVSATLFFDNVNKLKFKFTTTDLPNTVIKIAAGAGGEVETEIKTGADGYYYVLTDDIKATGFDTVYTVTAYVSGASVSTVKYNVNTYIYGMQNSLNEKMKNLARATYNYGKSATDFLQKGGQ